MSVESRKKSDAIRFTDFWQTSLKLWCNYSVYVVWLAWHGDKEFDGIRMAVETELCLGDGAVRNKATRENTVSLGIAVDADDASGSTTTRRGHGLPIAYKTNTKHDSYSKCTFTALEENVSHNESNYTSSDKTHSTKVQRFVRRSSVTRSEFKSWVQWNPFGCFYPKHSPWLWMSASGAILVEGKTMRERHQ